MVVYGNFALLRAQINVLSHFALWLHLSFNYIILVPVFTGTLNKTLEAKANTSLTSRMD